jgi:formylglycine-generating enzyme required for sulfatase activity
VRAQLSSAGHLGACHHFIELGLDLRESGLSFRRLRSHRCHEVKARHFGSGRRQKIPNHPNGVSQEPVDLAKAAGAGLHKLQTLQTSSWRAEAEAAKKRKSATNMTTPGRVFRDCPDCPEKVVVPAGSFVMGSNDGGTDEKPVHKVTIAKPFAVGKFDVTFSEREVCVAASGCKHKPEDQGWGRGTRPVINVS